MFKIFLNIFYFSISFLGKKRKGLRAKGVVAEQDHGIVTQLGIVRGLANPGGCRVGFSWVRVWVLIFDPTKTHTHDGGSCGYWHISDLIYHRD